MAFGNKNKKRESWSSRPLSMILSDNVWLFKNKSRNSVEKAMQQSNVANGKHIESAENAAALATPAAPSVASPPSNAKNSRKATNEASWAAVPSKTGTSQARRESKNTHTPKKSADTEKKDDPPFLTLNLDTSPQRLDVPEQYLDESMISGEFYSQAGSSEAEQSSEMDIPESVLGPLSSMAVEDSIPELKSSPDSDKAARPEKKTTRQEVDQLTAASTKNTAAYAPAPTRTSAPTTSTSPDLVFSDGASEPASHQRSATSTSSSKSAARESTVDSGLSGSSVATVDGPTRCDSYLLGSNRKVVVGRGVYIFDPTEPAMARELQLTAAESFNPFEFE